ncbi:DegV family protein [Planomonospora corallina]|uniref:DegV family protein n=1 Tax=Planomonospora corallina TaxID=1806052 RepID=A0ABV8I5G9_9ACTN
MSSPVAVVTDSTAYLPLQEATRLGITVVPLQVVIGGRAYDEMAQADRAELHRAFRERSPITTSRPAPRRFTDAYAAAAAAGARAVVSVHLSGEMSGTVEAARAGADDAPIPVEVIDSGSVAMGLAFPVLAAAEAAAHGGDRAAVAGAARRRMTATRTFFYLDTLEYLRRGGRIGTAASWLGSALAIKPLLHIDGGVIAPLEKVRTSTRAIARLEDLAVQAAGTGPVEVAVQHISSPSRAEALAERLARRLPEAVRVMAVEVGAVIGAHSGPGMLGVTVSPVPA